jgi:hypothetical protein
LIALTELLKLQKSGQFPYEQMLSVVKFKKRELEVGLMYVGMIAEKNTGKDSEIVD